MMALSHVSKVFAVKDAKIRKITTDPAGGVSTKGASIDVPGIKSVTVTGDVTTAELRGDNTRLDFQSVLGGVTVSFEYAKLSLDVLGALLGPAVADTGVTPNQESVLGLTGSNAQFAYFEFEAQAVSADSVSGDATILLYKCILSSFPEGLGMAEEDYVTFTMEAAALPRLSDGKWMDVRLRETSAALV